MSSPDSANQPVDLSGWLAYLERQHPLSIDLGLERVAAVAERMGLFAAPIAERLITVAGTNGKGSTVAMLEALAATHGLTTATYTSPHLLRYNERLHLNGREADDATLIAGFRAVEAARLAEKPLSLTYFEAGTLAALHAIAQRPPQLAILEVGLGGRLDAVNILAADVAVVTTVAQDHAAFLGTDIEQIGREKAGIMRSGHPAVLGSTALPASVRQHAAALGVPLYALGERVIRSEPDADGHWQWQGQADDDTLTLDHLPDPGLPLDNAASALQALMLAGVALDAESCRQGLTQVKLAGRMQWLGNWCLDVAHNPHAAHYVARRLAQRPCAGKRYALFGMLADKDAAGVVGELSGQIDTWVTASLDGERARSAAALAETLADCGQAVVQRAASVAAGVAWLKQRLGADDEVLVCGSFYTVAEALAELEVGQPSLLAEDASSRHEEGTA